MPMARAVAVALLWALLLHVAAGQPTIALGCFYCEPGTTRTIATLFLSKKPLYPHASLEVFDIGDGTSAGVVARYDALVAKNFTVLVMESVALTPAAIATLQAVHDVHPAFRLVMLSNDYPDDSLDFPWLAQLASRVDETGYVGGILSRKGRVACVTSAVLFWISRALVTGFITGLRDACPHCVADIQFEESLVASNSPQLYGARGADVTLLLGTGSGINHITTLSAQGVTNMTYMFAVLTSVRQQLPHRIQQMLPYASHLFIMDTAMDIAGAYTRPGGRFAPGTVFVGRATDALELWGCAYPISTSPCADAGIASLADDIIQLQYKKFLSGSVPTGMAVNRDGMSVEFMFPRLKAFQNTTLVGTMAGDRAVWGPNPVPVLLNNFKVVVFSPPFTVLWSYVYFANVMTNFPTPNANFLSNRQNFAAVGFDTYTIVFGGEPSTPEFSGDLGRIGVFRDVVRVQHPCAGVPETCTNGPVAATIAQHPKGGRQHSCVARLGSDILFVHGGVNDAGIAVSDTHLLNVTNGVWVEVAKGAVERFGHTCTQWSGADECVLVVGGAANRGGFLPSTPALFCLSNLTGSPGLRGAWRPTSGLPPTTLQHPCVFTTPQRAYLFGGAVHGNDDAMEQAIADAVWVLSPSHTWSRHAMSEPSFALPHGAMKCAVAHRIDEQPLNKTTAGRVDVDSIQSFHRVYMFGMTRDSNGDWFSSSEQMTLVTFPWLVCSEEDGLTLSVDGFACLGSGGGGSGGSDAWQPAVIAVGAILVVGALVATPIATLHVIRQNRVARALRFLPTRPKIAMATVQIRFVAPPPICEDGKVSRGELFGMIATKLRRVAERHRVHEAQRFADRFTYACDSPEQLFKMVVKQFQSVHDNYDQHACTLSVAISFGSASVRRSIASNGRYIGTAIIKGSVVKSVHFIAGYCPIGTLLVSQNASIGISPDIPGRTCVRGELAVLNDQTTCVTFEPYCSANARCAARRALDERETDERSERVKGFKAGTQNRVAQHQEDLCSLILHDMFRSLRKAKGAHRGADERLMRLLTNRFEITDRAIKVLTKARAKNAMVLRKEQADIVCRAVVRELYQPILSVHNMRLYLASATASNRITDSQVSDNPLGSRSIASSSDGGTPTSRPAAPLTVPPM